VNTLCERAHDGPNLTAYVGLAVRWGDFGRENKKLLNEQLFYIITAAVNTHKNQERILEYLVLRKPNMKESEYSV
jgi:hypothetical protein